MAWVPHWNPCPPCQAPPGPLLLLCGGWPDTKFSPELDSAVIRNPRGGRCLAGAQPPGSTPPLLQPLRSQSLKTRSDATSLKFPFSNYYSACGQSEWEEQTKFPRDRDRDRDLVSGIRQSLGALCTPPALGFPFCLYTNDVSDLELLIAAMAPNVLPRPDFLCSFSLNL